MLEKQAGEWYSRIDETLFLAHRREMTMNEELRRDIDSFAEKNRENIIRDISRLVAVNSVAGESEEGAPYGSGPAEALNVAFDIAHELGLETASYEGKMGCAMTGAGDRYLATITHLDIVPAGDGWSGDPFTLSEREGYLIGRGVMDDKGPSVLCLYALKYLKERDIELKYPIRALLGLSEETGMDDVLYYLDNYPAPLFCFSPDANFPLCNGEKGGFHGRIISKIALDNIIDIQGGIAGNVIPDKAGATVKAQRLQSTERVEAVRKGDGVWELHARGIGGHASQPEGTVNAIGLLVDYMLENDLLRGEEKSLFELFALMHRASDGSLLGIDASDDAFGPLTVIGGVIGVEDGHIFQTVDSRYPTSTDGGRIAARLQELAGNLAQVITDSDSVPFYMSIDNPAVQVCINAYNTITGENAKPYTIGGGTYARQFPNAVSFGPEHPERPQPDFAGPIHGADEAASVEFFMEALKVYILALLELEKLEF